MQVHQRSKKRAVAEINVVPYIDVMLVLLIIFMATAPVIMQGVTVDLPQADSQPLSEDMTTPVVASVDSTGRYFLDIGDSHKEAMDLVDLAGQVAQYLRIHPDAPVVVQGDAKVPYESVVQLMAALKEAGVPSVGLMTEPPANKK
ncbi:protein TolR [Pseudaeromonas sp. ZJS20]|uniref:protein TolR n=1 Tax=Pseudaeromonas aegiceratis TaxID=3153928 RepID=UPI00390C410A